MTAKWNHLSLSMLADHEKDHQRFNLRQID